MPAIKNETEVVLGNILTGQGINRADEGQGIIRASFGNKKVKKQQNGFSMPPHPLNKEWGLCNKS